MPRHQNSVVRSIIEQVFCFNLRKTHQDFDFFSSSKSLYVSLIFPYFIRALPAHNKGKRPPWLLDTYSPNYRELDKSRCNIELDNFRLNENYYSRRNRELDKSRRDENYYSLRNTLLLGHWYEIMALYYVKSILTEISASRQDRRVLQKSKIIRIEFLSKWGMLQTSRYV